MDSTSVSDHESRHNSSHEANDQPSEDTPLLRFPQTPDADRNTSTTIIVSMLLIILIAGVVIGIYLLIIQSHSENVLPPVENPLQLVARRQWDPSAPALTLTPFKSHTIIIVQTDTGQCLDKPSCIELLRDMQNSTYQELPYNFLVSTNGQTFEALGWNTPSPLFAQYPTAFVLAFIGDFTEKYPSSAQIVEAKNLIAESVSLQRLDPSYNVIGKTTKDKPKYLFDALKTLPKWNKNSTDV